jgi:alkylation response protein AidB-like acyl-CoA dehydrogenase
MPAIPIRQPVRRASDGADLVQTAAALGREFAVESSTRDLERRMPLAEFAKLRESGILAARVPAGFGGAEISILDQVRIFIHLAQGDPNIAQSIQPHACGLEKARLYGDDAQQRTYFERVLGGALITNASAERGTKFIGDMRTQIIPKGQGFRLRGVKHYATGSAFAAYFYVLARSPEGVRAIVVVPAGREGMRLHDDWNGMGQRTTASGTLELNDVQVDAEEVMWVPDFGKRRTHEGAYAQILHAAIDAGIALAALADGALYGRTSARPMPEARVEHAADDPYVQHAVGEMAVLAHGAVAMVERGARQLDAALEEDGYRGQAHAAIGAASIAVAEAKMAAGEAALRVSEMLYRVGGASAATRSTNLDRHWRNARTHTTHDPAAYKAKAVGDFYLNGALPPINTKI